MAQQALQDMEQSVKMDPFSTSGTSVQWADMLPEALAHIFSFLPLEDMMLTVPLVCKAWRKALVDPGCWRVVDLHEWSRLKRWDVIDKMVKLVVDRSRGKLAGLSVCRLMSDEPVEYVAERGDCLQILRIPFCQVTDSCLINIAPKFKSLVHLDISGCNFLSKVALTRIGQSCKSLIRLDRNMSYFQTHTINSEKDDEAISIAQNMPGLEHLELCYGSLSNDGLLAILENCTRLKHLDLRGCMNLAIEGSIADKCKSVNVVYNRNYTDHHFEMFDDWLDDMSDLHDDMPSELWDLDDWYTVSESDGSMSEDEAALYPLAYGSP